MNKKVSITLASLALVGGVLAGCNKDKDGEAKKVSGVQLKGMFTAYAPDETIDWSNVSLVITYSDKTTTTISAADIEFDVETPVNANTKAVISTDGLHGADLPTEKDYNMSVKLVGETQSYNAGAISVDSITPDKYELQTFFAPSFIDVYDKTMENAGKTEGTAEQLETYFKKGDEIFTVGNMNVFKFIPEVTFMKKGGSITSGGLKMTNSYKKTVIVEEHTDGYAAASEADYEVVREGIKFADSAAGKTFRITVKPEQFTVTKPAQFEFKVENGLNIYSAKELGALNLNSLEAENNAGNDYYECTYGIKNGIIANNDDDPIFYDVSTSRYVKKDTFAMWKEFLKNTGTFADAEITAYKDAPGYFLMNDITLETSDMPSEFFITSAESEKVAGSLRDGIHIYNIIPSVAKTINGNYFNVNTTKIPLCMSTSKSSGLKIVEETDSTVDPGHAILFYVPGQRDRANNDNYIEENVYKSGTKQVIFKNINTIGNTGDDLGHSQISGDENFKKMAKLTGLVAFKSGMAPVKWINCIVKQYMIGIMANYNLSTYDGGASVQIHNTRIYDCANAGAFNYECQSLYLKDSELKRFGGAAIFNACDSTRVFRGGYTKVDSSCVVENYVTGEEVYFSAVGAAGSIGTLKALNSFFKAPFAEAPFVKVIEGVEYMNVVSLTMEDGYINSDKRTYYGGTYLNVDKNVTIIDLSGRNSFAGQAYSMVAQMLGSYAPVMTVDGEFTINPGIVQKIKGNEAAAVVVFDPKNPASQDVVIPAEAGLGGNYYAGVYVPIGDFQQMPPVVTGLTRTTAYSGNYMHLAVPLGNTTLSLIFGL